jgi:hypothetical protein
MELLEATFLGNIIGSLQRVNVSKVLPGERLIMPDDFVGQNIELGLLLDECFQTFHGWPLEECCKENGDCIETTELVLKKNPDLHSLRASISANALARLAPFT